MMRLDVTLVEELSERIAFQLTGNDGVAVDVGGFTWAGYYRESGGETEPMTVEHGEDGCFVATFPAKCAGTGEYEIYQFDGTGEGVLLLRGQVVVLDSLYSEDVVSPDVMRRFRVRVNESGDVLQVRALPCTAAELVYRKGEGLLADAALQAGALIRETKLVAAEVLTPTMAVVNGAEEVVQENVIYFVRHDDGSYARYMKVGEEVVAIDDAVPPAGQIAETGSLIATEKVTLSENEVFAEVVASTEDGKTVSAHGVRGATTDKAGVIKLGADFQGNNEEFGATIYRATDLVPGLVCVKHADDMSDPIPEPNGAPATPHIVPTVDYMEKHINSSIQDMQNSNFVSIYQTLEYVQGLAESNAVEARGANYRRYSDGYVEVWGYIPAPSVSGVYEFKTSSVAPDVFFSDMGNSVQLTPVWSRKAYYTNATHWVQSVTVDESGFMTVSVFLITGVAANVRVTGWVQGTEFNEG